MSRNRKKNPASSFDDLVAQRESGKPQPSVVPTRLLVTSIKVREEVFQHRRIDDSTSNRHIRELADVAKSRDLDPIKVWWDGKKWALIDGHHRVKAYIRAGKGQHPVPVEVFHGNPEEALAYAAGANSRAKLQMSSSEKSAAAWSLVVLAEGLSKAKQAAEAGVSERLVALMRKAKVTLLSTGSNSAETLSAMTWNEARKQAAGDTSEWTPEEEEQRVEKMTLALRKALGPTADRQPDIFRQALERYSPRLAQALEEDYVEAYKELQEES